MTEIRRNLIRNLKRRRAFLRISQMELAERAGISASYVGELEMGRKFPKDEVITRLAAALGAKPFRLFMGPEDVADAAGSEAIYEAAETMRDSLLSGIDDALRPFQAEGEKGKKTRSRNTRDTSGGSVSKPVLEEPE